MKMKHVFFFLIYILVPIVLIPILWIKFENPIILGGAVFYYIGGLLAYFQLSIILPVPILFSMWYWYTYGLSIRDYVTGFLICILLGYFLVLLEGWVDRLLNNVLPGHEQEDVYNEKLKLYNKKVEEYMRTHSGEKISQETLDKIKADIFF